jgi:hypothetical protein
MYALQRVYQFATDSITGKVSEEHVLGTFDAKATTLAADADASAPPTEAGRAWQALWRSAADAAAADANMQQVGDETAAAAAAAAAAEAAASKQAMAPSPPPMLELLDYLPDTASMLQSWWPYLRQQYTGGEKCGGEGGGRPRSVELRIACSPVADQWRLLVREPQFCRYIMVLYHPVLCTLQRYKAVPRSTSKSGATATSDGTADASVM